MPPPLTVTLMPVSASNALVMISRPPTLVKPGVPTMTSRVWAAAGAAQERVAARTAARAATGPITALSLVFKSRIILPLVISVTVDFWGDYTRSGLAIPRNPANPVEDLGPLLKPPHRSAGACRRPWDR